MKSVTRRKTHWAVVLALAVVLVWPAAGWSWGEGGHKEITRLGVSFTPEPLRARLAPYLEALAEASMDPDRRKSDPGVVGESQRHFIDIDALEPFPFSGVPHDLAEAEAKYGKDRLQTLGTVPWAIAESFDNLVSAWREGRADWVRWLGDLSHYVADSHQPLHTTANFDGQKTGNRGVHALFETVMFDGFWKDAYTSAPQTGNPWWLPLGGGALGGVGGFLLAGPVGALVGLAGGALAGVLAGALARGVEPVDDPLEAAFEIITDSYPQLAPLLQAHDAAQAYPQTSPKFYSAFWEAGAGKIMIRQVNRAAQTLARFLMGAWIQAGRPAF